MVQKAGGLRRVAPDAVGLRLYEAAGKGELDAITRLATEWSGHPVLNWRNPSDNNRTPLFAACRHGKTDVARLLASLPGIDINTLDKDGRSPLYGASSHSKADCVRLLLSLPGIDVNLVSRAAAKDGQTPLAAAKTEEIKTLLRGAGGKML